MSRKRKDTIVLYSDEENDSDYEEGETKTKTKHKGNVSKRKRAATPAATKKRNTRRGSSSGSNTEVRKTFADLCADVYGGIACMLYLADFLKLQTVSKSFGGLFRATVPCDYFKAFFAKGSIRPHTLRFTHKQAYAYLTPYIDTSRALFDRIFGVYHGTPLQLAWLRRIVTNTTSLKALVCASGIGKLDEHAILAQSSVRCALCRGRLPVWPVCTYAVSNAGAFDQLMKPLFPDDLSKSSKLWNRLLVCNLCSPHRSSICVDYDHTWISAAWRFSEAGNNQFVRDRLPALGGRLLIEDLNLLWNEEKKACTPLNRHDESILADYKWDVTRRYPPGSRSPGGSFKNDPLSSGAVLRPNEITPEHKDFMAMWVLLPEALRKTHKIVAKVEYVLQDVVEDSPAYAAAAAAIAANEDAEAPLHLDIEDD